VSWSREQSLAVAASTLFGVGAGTALYYGYTAGIPPVGYDPFADDVAPEVQMVEQPTGFSEFTVNGNGSQEVDEFAQELGARGEDGNRTFTLGDDEEEEIPQGEEMPEGEPNVPEGMQGFDGIEQPLADATADAEDAPGIWESMWDGITGYWSSVEEAAGDAVEMAENLPAIAGGATEAATGSEAVAQAVEGIVAVDELVEVAL
jgi:hypothetical protein